MKSIKTYLTENLNESQTTKIIEDFITQKIDPVVNSYKGKKSGQKSSGKTNVVNVAYTDIKNDCVEELVNVFGMTEGAIFKQLTSADATESYNCTISSVSIQLDYNTKDEQMGFIFADSKAARYL